MSKKIAKLILVVVAVCAVVAFFALDLGQYLTLDYIKQSQSKFQQFYSENQFQMILIFSIIYVTATALSLPGALILTISGGAIFGVYVGTAIVSLSSTLGAGLAFLASRFLFHETVQKRFGDKLDTFNRGVEKEGAFYLFTLRLIPVFPFFLINLLMGLTSMKTATYFVVSWIGMLPGTLAYVYAGQEISKIDKLGLPSGLLIAFAVLGLMPLVAKKLIDFLRQQKVYRKHSKPKKFDYNMVVIGAGSAGLVSSLIAATVKAKVALIEKHKMGGDCLNTGCVPSKAIIKTAKVIQQIKDHKKYGLQGAEFQLDFAQAMQRVQDIIKKIEPHDSVERFTGMGVECIQGTANIESPWCVSVDGKMLTTKNIIVATGAGPFVPPIPGLDKVKFLTSDNIWELRELPQRLVVLGGGPIGSELAQTFARLGSKVTQVERFSRIMGREDEDASAEVTRRFKADGIEILTEHSAVEFKQNQGTSILVCEKTDGSKREVEFDYVLVAVGRRPNTKGFGLEELGITLNPNGTIEHNEYMQTKYPNIYVCGDVAGPFQFTHTASHQAWFASVNALFSPLKKFRADYRVIPWATYTDPEVARVGLSESEAAEKKIEVEVVKYGIDDLDRAIADSDDHGFVKILVRPGSDKILGVTIVGTHAGDLLQEFVLAMKHGIGLNKIMGTIHPYPTLVEANKFAASEWKKKHKPEKLLEWVGKFHTWRRG